MTIHAKATIVSDLAGLRARVAAWHAQGESVALVPTMGALHDGHMELAREGKRRADRVVLTIFVNPTQFAPNEDFTTYPRSLEADCARFDAVGGDLVYAPETSQIYPSGFATTISVAGPAIVGLEDRFRPTHFAGVATIVAKLLIQAQPDVALFGEKDFQQLCVIWQMAGDLDLPVTIVGVPVVRDRDGLALSSRNVYLDAGERAVAPLLYATLTRCAAAIIETGAIEPNLEAARAALTSAGFVIDYLEARHTETLLPLEDAMKSGRILVAARLGRTRLIDNVAIIGMDGELS
ncbi:pantoate--beta-alanine ligase [Beijerinckia sp. L45]|uniref:pantoate--beta-alanine ligase n=1 Tax=Beijerinckia sp. L45 TaxID=1641855 RepID=UPI00131A792C|nr:pantoate--beta-alanine ligase [Beijerinckia sp. L45]